MPKKTDPRLKGAIRLVREHRDEYPSITAAADAVARQLGVGAESVRRWVVQVDVDAGGRPGMTSEEHTEINRLRAEVRRLEEDNKILRAVTVFFAGELDRAGVALPTCFEERSTNGGD